MKLLFFLLFALLQPPQLDSEKIFWNENEKLRWTDFRGNPLRTANFVASTNTGLSFQYSYSIKNGEVRVEYSVQSFFNPEGSWFLPDGVNPYILKHEQAHFDISELHARMLRKNLEGRKFSTKVKSEMEAIYQKVEQQRRAMQTKFDAETDHSRKKEKEATWQKFIAQKLTEYVRWK
ncbi:DUF922 domain-containing protein [Vitellibacter sp. q18]|jgi:hypothetical protein|nr:DUF922 domain-containing protein [Aequorivita lutea]